jgi:tRNA pseudouridine55 synthase
VGWTSFDVVAFIRGRSHTRRTGHAGTLDPFAEGVLPVCLGKATRVIEYLMDARKTYRATVRLGVETDTYDRTGSVVAQSSASTVTRVAAEDALREFEGDIQQTPPAYSALKRDGVPLYKLARAGEKVEIAARSVHIYRIGLTSWEPPLLAFEVECGKGTYVRSLAHDIGRRLGVGGSLDALVRTAVGPFKLESSVGVETLRAEFESDTWQERLLGLDEVLLDWPAAILGIDNESRLRHGQRATVTEVRQSGERARAYSLSGDFVAVMRREAAGVWRPEKVL